ncbi:PREDICTED: uncharacterized protein LOC108759191 [Trachymyrmex cornetzi]|uniref:uncharacterized protein LOC108759191 n=1 Tax=Trachymyrmex cornetzi TaxID=471704 RepID=UPI00084F81BE|nr:PREDICTED: uncharacterized protein LOC108759191 [Trachymyrmex cornetzi]
MVVMGTNLSPRLDAGLYEEALEELEGTIQQLRDRPICVMGDFNAKAVLWKSKVTDLRGKMVVKWASRLGMCCLNRGRESTCIKTYGESIVDLSFANPAAARRVTSWKMHAHATDEKRNPPPKRWAVRKMDRDMLSAALIASCWPNHEIADNAREVEIEDSVERLQGTMIAACNMAMPKSEPRPSKAMPWWTEELDQLRDELTAARRRMRRMRRR